MVCCFDDCAKIGREKGLSKIDLKTFLLKTRLSNYLSCLIFLTSDLPLSSFHEHVTSNVDTARMGVLGHAILAAKNGSDGRS